MQWPQGRHGLHVFGKGTGRKCGGSSLRRESSRQPGWKGNRHRGGGRAGGIDCRF